MSLKHIWIYSSTFLINFHASEGRIVVLSLLLSRSVRFILPLPRTGSRPRARQTRSSTSAPHFRTASPNRTTSTEGACPPLSPQQLSSCSQRACLPDAMAGKSIGCPHARPGTCPTMRQVLQVPEKCHFILRATVCVIRAGLSKQRVMQRSRGHGIPYVSLSTEDLASRISFGQEMFSL